MLINPVKVLDITQQNDPSRFSIRNPQLLPSYYFLGSPAKQMNKTFGYIYLLLLNITNIKIKKERQRIPKPLIFSFFFFSCFVFSYDAEFKTYITPSFGQNVLSKV